MATRSIEARTAEWTPRDGGRGVGPPLIREKEFIDPNAVLAFIKEHANTIEFITLGGRIPEVQRIEVDDDGHAVVRFYN